MALISKSTVIAFLIVALIAFLVTVLVAVTAQFIDAVIGCLLRDTELDLGYCYRLRYTSPVYTVYFNSLSFQSQS